MRRCLGWSTQTRSSAPVTLVLCWGSRAGTKRQKRCIDEHWKERRRCLGWSTQTHSSAYTTPPFSSIDSNTTLLHLGCTNEHTTGLSRLLVHCILPLWHALTTTNPLSSISRFDS